MALSEWRFMWHEYKPIRTAPIPPNIPWGHSPALPSVVYPVPRDPWSRVPPAPPPPPAVGCAPHTGWAAGPGQSPSGSAPPSSAYNMTTAMIPWDTKGQLNINGLLKQNCCISITLRRDISWYHAPFNLNIATGFLSQTTLPAKI